ncbi:MAG: hypothetical protein ACREJ2_11045 [Planctomycetota bacterium]
MDRIEIVGYSGAGACLVATLAVFFLWIHPMNKSIAQSLAGMKTESAKLDGYVKADQAALTTDPTDPNKTAMQMPELLGTLQQVLVTPDITKLLMTDRQNISKATGTLIQAVVKAHEADAPKPPSKEYLPLTAKLRSDLSDLFKKHDLAVPKAEFFNLPDERKTDISENEYWSFKYCYEVMSKLLGATTQVKMLNPTVDSNGNISPQPATVTAQVTGVMQFMYFNEDQWKNRTKQYDTELTKLLPKPTGGKTAAAPGPGPGPTVAVAAPATAAKPAAGGLGGAAAAPMVPLVTGPATPLPYHTMGFRVMFVTNPVNVPAAIAALESFDPFLVTVERLEVTRAGNAFYTYKDWQDRKQGIPLPYGDGDVTVTADVQLLYFDKGTAEKLASALYSKEN